ncbi:MAG: HAD-IA family hydrolase [Motiliproteus sp.]|nr:HAD-IA family hydrolase [Motiliproteus sp.]MCW9052965.1 HAD-IA family hydrolase [Motiliproteus sp.]
MFKFLIFDWDGTLIDSAARIISSMQKAAEDVGMPHPSDKSVKNIIGLGLPEALQEIFPGIETEQIQQMREKYSHFYLEADRTPTNLFPGVEEGLRRLNAKGYRMAVATGKSRRGLDRVFEQTGLGELFHHSRCADETRSKPHPLMLHELLQESGMDVSQALMVGDTEFDLEMAVNAGMKSVGVSYGAHEIDRLNNHKPMSIFDQFGDFEAWLDESRV